MVFVDALFRRVGCVLCEGEKGSHNMRARYHDVPGYVFTSGGVPFLPCRPPCVSACQLLGVGSWSHLNVGLGEGRME